MIMFQTQYFIMRCTAVDLICIHVQMHFISFRIKMQQIPDLVPSILALNGSIVYNALYF